MNLNLLKELEDAKAKGNNLGSQLNHLIVNRNKLFIANAREDFNNFFKSQGFQVVLKNDECHASYNNLTAKLTFPDPEIPLVAVYTVFEFFLTGFDQMDGKYKIRVHDKGRFPTAISTTRRAPKTEDERIMMEIERTNKSISELEQKVAQFSQSEWAYAILKESPNVVHWYPQFDTMEALLKDTFK